MKSHTTWFPQRYRPARREPPPRRVASAPYAKQERVIKAEEAANEEVEARGEESASFASARFVKQENEQGEENGFEFEAGERASEGQERGVDSCPSHHMAGDKSMLAAMNGSEPVNVYVANNELLRSALRGNAHVKTWVDRDGTFVERGFVFRDVLYVPGLSRNLVSVACLEDHGLSVNLGER